MRIVKILRNIILVLLGTVLMIVVLMAATLQQSYRYCPPSEEEIAQMGIIEKWVYAPFEK